MERVRPGISVVPQNGRTVEPRPHAGRFVAALLLCFALPATGAPDPRGPAASVSAERFGAKGDGVTDDRIAIQAALQSGASRVSLSRGKTYLVSYSGAEKTIRGVPHRYALAVPSRVTFDLQGATLKLGAGANASVIVNAGAGTSPDERIEILNGTIDGNRSEQTLPSSGEMPCVYLDGARMARVRDLRIIGARQYAGRFLDVSSSAFDSLSCSGSDGDCWSFGIAGSPRGALMVRNSTIDHIEATAALGRIAGLQGNGVIFTVEDTRVGSVTTRSCAGGLKIQDTSARSTFESLTFIGPDNGSNNSGIKVQSNRRAGLFPEQIRIARAVSRNAFGPGLFVAGARDLTIDSYVGEGNGNASYEDVWIESNDRFRVGTVRSIGARVNAIKVLGSPREFSIGRIVVRNPGGIAFAMNTSGVDRFHVGALEATDDRPVPLLSAVVKVADADAVGLIDRVATNLRSTSGHPRLVVAGDHACRMTIGRFQQANAPLEGDVALVAGDTQTFVETPNAFSEATDRMGSSFEPVVAITPTVRPDRSRLRARPQDIRTRPGFTVEHPRASRHEHAHWTVQEWRCVPPGP